jgi:predicted nucleotidyltransferase
MEQVKTPSSIRIAIPQPQIIEFCRRWKVREFSLFGSAVRDDFGPESDVDVLVRFERNAPWSLFDFVTMQDELAELFGRDVDIVEEESLRNPFRRESILRDKRVIYAA